MSGVGPISPPGCLVHSFNRQPSASLPMMRMVIARGFFARLRGLLGTSTSWSDGDTVLMIPQCRSVHTFGMRYPLDIAFVDEHGIVMRSYRNVAPGRLLSCKNAAVALERPYIAETFWLVPGKALVISSF